jgi:hypothetical protein
MKYYKRIPGTDDYMGMSLDEYEHLADGFLKDPFVIATGVIIVLIILTIVIGAYIEYGTIGELPMD